MIALLFACASPSPEVTLADPPMGEVPKSAPAPLVPAPTLRQVPEPASWPQEDEPGDISVEVGNGQTTFEADDSTKVRNRIRRSTQELEDCYRKQWRQSPGLEGEVEVGWELEGGAVKAVYVVTNTTGDPTLAVCILKRLKRWKFDAELTGSVSWPVSFHPPE